MPIVVTNPARREQLRRIASWDKKDRGTSGKGIAIALASLYLGLGVLVAAIALGGFVLATTEIERLWLAAPIGVAAPVFAGWLWQHPRPKLDLVLGVVCGVRVVPP